MYFHFLGADSTVAVLIPFLSAPSKTTDRKRKVTGEASTPPVKFNKTEAFLRFMPNFEVEFVKKYILTSFLHFVFFRTKKKLKIMILESFRSIL
jgi:hypothetical protein